MTVKDLEQKPVEIFPLNVKIGHWKEMNFGCQSNSPMRNENFPVLLDTCSFLQMADKVLLGIHEDVAVILNMSE